MCVLAIDGGGTKTIGVLADESGKVFANATVGATNQYGLNKMAVIDEIRRLLQNLKFQNPTVFDKTKTVFAGIAGADHIEAKTFIKEVLQSSFSDQVNIIVDHDAINALYSGTLGHEGIVHISGTGSITFGINEKGERGRVGGWGYLFDDEGSGYALGREAISAIFKEFDGRGERTLLSKLIVKHFQVHSIPDLIPIIYSESVGKRGIAQLSKLVNLAAEEKDIVALEILNNAARQIKKSITTLYYKLFVNPKHSVHIVLTGGLLINSPKIQSFISNEIKKEMENVEIIIPDLPPIAGAIIAALKNNSKRIHPKFIDNFHYFFSE